MGMVRAYLIRDNDSKFGPCFARVAKTSTIKILKTPVHAPRANAICERFLGSVRQECLDHLLILHERQHEPRAEARMWPTRNQARPHQGIAQQIASTAQIGSVLAGYREPGDRSSGHGWATP